jgi:hypothetical protein
LSAELNLFEESSVDSVVDLLNLYAVSLSPILAEFNYAFVVVYEIGKEGGLVLHPLVVGLQIVDFAVTHEVGVVLVFLKNGHVIEMEYI